ncbi:MAG TPA: PPOX class F420-dependent oxidoreductase [Gaiellaceae bacterium]|nr:PPOX class F420-dependent oxidoreductase [Gaiellaceae bacterium]
MPQVPVPPELDALLAQPNPAVVGTVRPDGSPHTAATWYDWEGGRILLNMEDTRLRLGYLRQNPHVSLTVLAAGDWYHHVTLLGRVVSLDEDAELRDIDRLSLRYTGRPYAKRDRARFSAWVQPERWHAWPKPR